jgi:hypothetical protein
MEPVAANGDKFTRRRLEACIAPLSSPLIQVADRQEEEAGEQHPDEISLPIE